jgi:high affinity Mn2+ porin
MGWLMGASRLVTRNVILIGTALLAATISAPSPAQQGPINLSMPRTEAATGPPEDWSIHAQYTLLGQGYPRFRSPYQGTNSLPGDGQIRETMSQTTFLGRRLWNGGELYVNPEFNQGFGLADTLGLAGFPNGEARKAGEHVPKLNIARLYLKQTIGLGGEQEFIADGLNQIAGPKDLSRLTIYAGKLALNDLFDNNAYSHDPRNDFHELGDMGRWSLRLRGGPKGIHRWGSGRPQSKGVGIPVWLLSRAEILEFPRPRYIGFPARWLPGRNRTALRDILPARQAPPSRLCEPGSDGRLFPGTDDAGPQYCAPARFASKPASSSISNRRSATISGFFARFSYNDGSNEIMSFTDIDRSGQLGISLKGSTWGRPDDVIGIAGVVNALSRRKADFLAAGGRGVLMGDGKLNYATENIIEAYYRRRVADLVAATFDYQLFVNPGYNQARGPVSVLGGRVHFEF